MNKKTYFFIHYFTQLSTLYLLDKTTKKFVCQTIHWLKSIWKQSEKKIHIFSHILIITVVWLHLNIFFSLYLMGCIWVWYPLVNMQVHFNGLKFRKHTHDIKKMFVYASFWLHVSFLICRFSTIQIYFFLYNKYLERELSTLDHHCQVPFFHNAWLYFFFCFEQYKNYSWHCIFLYWSIKILSSIFQYCYFVLKKRSTTSIRLLSILFDKLV